MSYLIVILLWVVGVAAACYALVRLTVPTLLRTFDRSRTRPTDSLGADRLRPHYYARDPDGTIDLKSRWPGWDGWYFVVIPDDTTLPFKMIRVSLMTGLYGLNGVDDYRKLPNGLSPFHAVEFLTLADTERPGADGQGVEFETRLIQQYLPKATALSMQPDTLEVSVRAANDDTAIPAPSYGSVRGSWPMFSIAFSAPSIGVDLQLEHRPEHVLWWADVPGLFTYFAAVGRVRGKVRYHPHPLEGDPMVVDISGQGSLEHGYARKPFNFDALYWPIRMVQRLKPAVRPIRYDYELLFGDNGWQGGFMRAVGFGIPFRNHGGLFIDGRHVPIERVHVEYLDDPPPDIQWPDRPGAGPPFFRRWRVRGITPDGVLEYEGRRDGAPAYISSNMIYHRFSVEGSYCGKPLVGHGYGEYLCM